MKKIIINTSKTGLLVLFLLVSQTLTAQDKKMMPNDGSTVTMSKYSFDETVDILKGAIEGQNLMVIHEVDGQKMLKMAGKNIGGMKQLYFFHPKYMAKLLEANEMAGIQVPLKLIIMEKGDKVMIRYFMPSAVLSSYKGTESIANELDGLVSKIISETTK